jgi:ABC-type amino acid transport substrate-binding protein
VTAHLSAADLAVRADVRVIAGPPPEPRAVILPLHRVPDADSDQLLRAVNDAIVAMQADGTLTRLSQKRFGGDDLTAP